MRGYPPDSRTPECQHTVMNTICRMLLATALLLGPGVAPALLAGADTDDSPWVVVDEQGAASVRLYFFWSTRCPHCRHALPFVEDLARRHSWLDLQAMEVNSNSGHRRLYQDLAESLGQQASSVPAFLYCGTMITGFGTAETTGPALEAALQDCYRQVRLKGRQGWRAFFDDQTQAPLAIDLPGNINLGSLSLPVTTLLLAGLDSFNPCAFFILLFLLSLLVHARSRARMLLVGGLFVTVSGLVYFVFMAAWLNLFMLSGNIAWVTSLAGAVALIIGLINIKDFFWPHRGVNLSIPGQVKPHLYQRVRNLLHTRGLPALLIGTIMLALVANSYELLCTAGFPMVYTRILTANELSTSSYYSYLLLYNLVYITPLLVIVIIFCFTLGTHKLSERGGRLLKLLSGLMMLGLGLVLVLAPALLNNAVSALILLCTALLLTLLAAHFLPD